MVELWDVCVSAGQAVVQCSVTAEGSWSKKIWAFVDFPDGKS